MCWRYRHIDRKRRTVAQKIRDQRIPAALAQHIFDRLNGPQPCALRVLLLQSCHRGGGRIRGGRDRRELNKSRAVDAIARGHVESVGYRSQHRHVGQRTGLRRMRETRRRCRKSCDAYRGHVIDAPVESNSQTAGDRGRPGSPEVPGAIGSGRQITGTRRLAAVAVEPERLQECFEGSVISRCRRRRCQRDSGSSQPNEPALWIANAEIRPRLAAVQ